MSGSLTDITSPYGQVTTVTHASNGYLASVTNPNSEIYSITYLSGTDLMDTFTKPGGQTSTFIYNSYGQLEKDTGHGGNFISLIRDKAQPDWPLVVSSQMGRETKYIAKLNSSGSFVRSETLPDGLVRTYKEDSTINKDANSIATTEDTLQNDERFGSLLQRASSRLTRMNSVSSTTTFGKTVSYPPGITDVFGFSTITNTATTSGNTTTSVYTASTKTAVVTSPEGATATTILDAYERPSSLKVGSDTPWTYTYDSNGRVSQATQGSHNTLDYAYNLSGFLSSITNVLSETTSFVYDSAGRITSTTLPDSRIISYAYDANGNLTSVTPPSKPSHAFSFNAMELISTYSPPSLVGVSPIDTTYTYNLDKQLTNVTRPNGAAINYTYNATTGLLSNLGIAAGNFTYTYKTGSDQWDVISSPDDYNNTFGWYGYKFKSDAQRQTSTNTLYGKTTFTFDGDHRVNSRIIQGKSSATTYTQNISYNNDSMPTQIGNLSLGYGYPSGRLSTTSIGKISDARTYDSYGQLASYTAIYTPTSGPVQTLYSYTLTRDLIGRITSKSETVLGTTNIFDYTYDSTGRLTQVLKNSAAYSSYVFDSNGNRTSGVIAGTSFTATYDDQDRLLTHNGRAYSYNNNGDLTQIQISPGVQSSYVYNALGSLKQVTLTSGAVLSYSYDGLNRRIRKMENSTFKSHYIYENGQRIAAHTNNSGVIQKEYVYGVEHINVPDFMAASGVEYRLIKDHLGSPRLVVNTNDGTVAQRIDYNDLGMVTADTNQGFQHFGFAGGLYDGQSKLVRFGARDYDAETGRFTSKDPIGFNGGDTNLYGYVANDPVNWVDPDGMRKNFVFQGGNLSFYGDSGELLFEGPAVSGPWGNGALPKGSYSVGAMRDGRSGSFACGGSNGYSLDLESRSPIDRSLLRIHPDGGTPGTKGCVGVSCQNGAADALGEILRGIYNQPMTPWIDLEVR